MKLKVQRRIAASLLKCSPKRVVFDTDRLEEIKEAITKADLRGLINDNAIAKKSKKGISRGRAREKHAQKKQGRLKGMGSRKGTKKARSPKKRNWMNKVRSQREHIRKMKDSALIEQKAYRSLYSKIKGGFFRSKRHIDLYVKDLGLIKDGKKN